MINALKSLFILPPSDSPEEHEHRVHLASAALLIETARADFRQVAELTYVPHQDYIRSKLAVTPG